MRFTGKCHLNKARRIIHWSLPGEYCRGFYVLFQSEHSQGLRSKNKSTAFFIAEVTDRRSQWSRIKQVMPPGLHRGTLIALNSRAGGLLPGESRGRRCGAERSGPGPAAPFSPTQTEKGAARPESGGVSPAF